MQLHILNTVSAQLAEQLAETWARSFSVLPRKGAYDNHPTNACIKSCILLYLEISTTPTTPLNPVLTYIMTVTLQPNLVASTASAPIAPFSVTKGDESFTIREARRDELDAIGWAAGQAFIDDAVVHYMAGSKKVSVNSSRTLVLKCVYSI